MSLRASGNKCDGNSEKEDGMISHSAGKPCSDDTASHAGSLLSGCISLAPVCPYAPFDLCFEHIGQKAHNTHS